MLISKLANERNNSSANQLISELTNLLMANLKEVRIRIASVISTQQITKAMKMVSAAKLRRAQDAIVQMRPYAAKLREIMENISETLESSAGGAFATQRPVNKVWIVAINSNRG